MALVAVAVALALVVPNRWMLAGCDIAVAVGMLLVGLSSTPAPPMLLPLWFVATLTAIVAMHFGAASLRVRAMLAAPAVVQLLKCRMMRLVQGGDDSSRP